MPAELGSGPWSASCCCRRHLGKNLVTVTGVLRVVSWNRAYGKPARFKTIAIRRRQWALIAALAPDIALLQECRPSDLNLNAPAWMADEYRCVGVLQQGWRLCTSMLVREPLAVEPLDLAALGESERRWLGFLPSRWAAGTVSAAGLLFAVASVHALADKVEVGTAVTSDDHERIRRTGLDRAIHNDVNVAALEPSDAGRRFVVGGDWNDSPLFDTYYPKRALAGSSTEFSARRQRAGWCDAMRRFHDTDIRTYLDPKSGPYELDQCSSTPEHTASSSGATFWTM